MASEREGQEPRDPSTKATCRGLQRVSNKAGKERPGARSKFAGKLSTALSQHHLLGFETAQLEFHHLH